MKWLRRKISVFRAIAFLNAHWKEVDRDLRIGLMHEISRIKRKHTR